MCHLSWEDQLLLHGSAQQGGYQLQYSALLLKGHAPPPGEHGLRGMGQGPPCICFKICQLHEGYLPVRLWEAFVYRGLLQPYQCGLPLQHHGQQIRPPFPFPWQLSNDRGVCRRLARLWKLELVPWVGVPLATARLDGEKQPRFIIPHLPRPRHG